MTTDVRAFDNGVKSGAFDAVRPVKITGPCAVAVVPPNHTPAPIVIATAGTVSNDTPGGLCPKTKSFLLRTQATINNPLETNNQVICSKLNWQNVSSEMI